MAYRFYYDGESSIRQSDVTVEQAIKDLYEPMHVVSDERKKEDEDASKSIKSSFIGPLQAGGCAG